MAVARFLWSEVNVYTAYVEVPDGFEYNDYDVHGALATINTDAHYTGLEDRSVDEFELVPRVAVPPNEEVEQIDWASHDERTP